MMDTIEDRHIAEFKRIDTLEAGHVEAILAPIRPALVMRINSTNRAEVVFCCHRVESIK
jgi:hypothetical protein